MQLVPIPNTDEPPRAGTHSELVAGVVASTRDLYARKGFVAPWIGYLAFDEGEYVGTCAFVGPPEGREVEIAYYSFPACQRAGVATRMTGELLKVARLQVPAVTVVAHTMREEGPSTIILRKHGFKLLGEVKHPEDGPVWKWALSDPAS
ncbi:GNAT family N-acetyltransferase [Ramlibacter terrae]|uniref:GNAT family N-acetyltransferase n=1 Tax=Ramlibacter terrae TaxID=2732511 RepID=A0ABX6P736_9BURK|nr:GNAT family N-acetyltransferase [Ramlibacter terrae]